MGTEKNVLAFPLLFPYDIGSTVVLGKGSCNMEVNRQLFCGAAKEKITPPEDMLENLSGLMDSRFGGVVDDLYVRVISLQSGSQRLLLVSFDLDKASCPQENMAALVKETGISQEAILFIGIHTHSAPITGDRTYEGPNDLKKKPEIIQKTTKQYEDFVQRQMLLAAKKAIEQMVPAVCGWGYGESHVNVNRIAFYDTVDEKGCVHTKVSTGVNWNRPADPTLFAAEFQDKKGNPIAFFVNYACHNTVMILNCCGKNGKVGISSDMGGNVSKYMEAYYPGSVAMWSSGAAGDINPIMSNQVYREDPRTGEPVEIYEKDGAVPLSQLSTLTAHHFADVQRTVRGICNYTGILPLSAGACWAEVPGADENGSCVPYRVRVHKIGIGKLQIIGFSGELYSALGRELTEGLYDGPLILVNHDASLLYNAGYIYSDEAFALARQYEGDIVGMSHTWLRPGLIAPKLRRCMEKLLSE